MTSQWLNRFRIDVEPGISQTKTAKFLTLTQILRAPVEVDGYFSLLDSRPYRAKWAFTLAFLYIGAAIITVGIAVFLG